MGNKTPQTPTFKDAMTNFAKDLRFGLYCHLPGTIVDFDRTKGTATVQPGVKRVYPNYAAPGGQKTAPYPTLTKVPVFLLQGGGASVGADPKSGDYCLLLVADRNMDAWKQNGGQQAPLSDRAHDLSDCFALVGFNPTVKPPQSARLAGECGVADLLAKVVVKNGLVNISTGAGAISLKTILTTFLAAVAADPIFLATSPAVAAAAAAAETQLATLLY